MVEPRELTNEQAVRLATLKIAADRSGPARD
jgi:hypothetical protein